MEEICEKELFMDVIERKYLELFSLFDKIQNN
jgi:hypothetical protein